MNPLYEPFPDYVIANGKKVRIVTDFREYIKLMDLLKDEDIEEDVDIEDQEGTSDEDEDWMKQLGM